MGWRQSVGVVFKPKSFAITGYFNNAKKTRFYFKLCFIISSSQKRQQVPVNTQQKVAYAILARVNQSRADYVNTDVINELIKEQDVSNGSSNSRHHQHHPNAAILERPKSVAEISQKENGCVIKIKGDEVSKSTSGSAKPKRSASTVSSTSAMTKNDRKPSDKASRLLGIEEVHCNNISPQISALDSGRFSMGSSLSPANEKKSIICSTNPTTNNSTISILLKSEDKTKFKSLGDLHMEKGLPTVLVHPNDDQDHDEESKTSLLHACRKMLKNTKKILARETKTLEITPFKASKSRSSLPGGGQKQTLQLISHTTFPGLPTYPVLAASHSSPWNC